MQQQQDMANITVPPMHEQKCTVYAQGLLRIPVPVQSSSCIHGSAPMHGRVPVLVFSSPPQQFPSKPDSGAKEIEEM